MDVELSQRLALVIDWISAKYGFEFKEEFVSRCDEAEDFDSLSEEDQALVLKAESALDLSIEE